MAGPLEGVQVIEMGQLVAGPFCGQLLADLGADVVKIEPPGVGDPLRQWGRAGAQGHGLWWPIAARGKRSVTLDLRRPEGQQLARRLVRDADVILENFRPGTLEGWGLGWDELSGENPRLVMVRVSGFGQTGPYAARAGYASIGEAMGGLRYVVGDPSTPPSRTGISLGDSLAAMFATIGALAALRQASDAGRGQVVDASIFESVLAVMESLLPEYVIAGMVRERTGPILPNVAPSNLYPTLDGDTLLIAANQDTVFTRLCAAMGRPTLARDPRYATHVARGEHQGELDDLIARWTETMVAEEVLALLVSHAVPAGRMYRAPEMLRDPHFAARQAIVEIDHPALGPFPMQNVVPKFSETPGSVAWLGPELGQHTREVLGGRLGLSDADLARLADDGVI